MTSHNIFCKSFNSGDDHGDHFLFSSTCSTLKERKRENRDENVQENKTQVGCCSGLPFTWRQWEARRTGLQARLTQWGREQPDHHAPPPLRTSNPPSLLHSLKPPLPPTPPLPGPPLWKHPLPHPSTGVAPLCPLNHLVVSATPSHEAN